VYEIKACGKEVKNRPKPEKEAGIGVNKSIPGNRGLFFPSKEKKESKE